MSRFLAWCAGADIRRIGPSVVERARYLGTGVALVLTALLAAGTATLLLHQVSGFWSYFFLPIALFWAVCLFNIDRLLVTSFDYGPLDRARNDLGPPPTPWWHRIATYAARIALAGLVAYSVAEPAMLVLFQSEVTQQLASDKALAGQAAQKQVQDAFAAQRSAIDRPLTDAQTASDAANGRAQTALDQFDAEVNGTGGTRQVGCERRVDGACEGKRRAWLQAEKDAAGLRGQLDTARTTHDKAIGDLNAKINAAEADRNATIDRNDGFLASAKALDEVVAANPGLQARRWAIAALILLIDLLPVLIKLFAPPTLYERTLRRKAIARVEREAKRDDMKRLARERRHELGRAQLEIDHEVAVYETGLQRERRMKAAYQQHREALAALHERYARTSVLDPDPLDTVVLPWPGKGGTFPRPAPAPPGPVPDEPTVPALVLNNRWSVGPEPPPGGEFGGMGETRVAIDLQQPARKVVVKRVRQGGATNSVQAQRLAMQFEKELRRHSLVRSDHVAPVVDTGHDLTFGTFIVTELYPATVARRLADARRDAFDPDLQWALRMTRQTLQGLVDCWSRGIVHLDIKPANVALDESDRVRLIDFGLAKLTAGGADPASNGVNGYTLFYAPYEQIVQRPAKGWCTSACDVRATGATLYEILTGRPPLWREAEDMNLIDGDGLVRMGRISELIDLIRDHRPARPGSFPFLAGLPAEVDALVGHMLEPAPQGRPRDVAAALAEVDAALDTVARTRQGYRPVGWAARRSEGIGEGA